MLDLSRYWYGHPSRLFFLKPFSWLFGFGASLRRKLYVFRIFKTKRFPVPVIVVGNVTVGGTGKTPLVIWLANLLREQGRHPGIVSRGVGGKKQVKPHPVQPHDSATVVGDEALLLRQKTGCPVVICRDRPAAVQYLLKQSNCDVVISDDGLQHYSLGRDIEIVMVDGARRFGNHQLLPAGPLREPVSRLNEVDFIIVNGGDETDPFVMQVEPAHFVSLKNQQKIAFHDFSPKKIHAMAGIGHPQRFFSMLKQKGFDLIEHIFPDHHRYLHKEIQWADAFPVVMTEKDAVKCRDFADDRYWYLTVDVKINNEFKEKLLEKLQSLENCHDSETDFNQPTCTRFSRLQSSGHRD